MFVVDADKDYRPIDGIRPSICDRLPAGVYVLGFHPEAGMFLRPEEISVGCVVDFESPIARLVRREVQVFFDPEISTRLKAAGVSNRRGVIIHGEPGSGKTSLIRSLLPTIIAHDAVVLLEPDAETLHHNAFPAIRANDPHRPIVVLWDEIDKNIRHSYHTLLRLLDGMDSPSDFLILGTTNHLDSIPDEMRVRPSRFSLIVEMTPLGEIERIAYACSKYPMISSEDARLLVQSAAGMPIDYVEEACRLHLMGYDFDDIHFRLQLTPRGKSGVPFLTDNGDGGSNSIFGE